ncbi:MAG: hypothetical protein F6K04_00825 [Leptolyngbya sp. SIO4C5]|uniref:hypothetical protein n=1 Tax=Sphaerothrix gracilis TaxID=3151835 RepID=UPI0013C274CF|nr:hypothetical protein [Leptolyngbya sp. SIO4C5]
MHPFIQQLLQVQPEILSIYWNGQQILRIEDGEVVLERSVRLRAGLLTVHFDDEPAPVYFLATS